MHSQLQLTVFCLTCVNLSMLEQFHQYQNVYVGDPVIWCNQQCQKLLTHLREVDLLSIDSMSGTTFSRISLSNIAGIRSLACFVGSWSNSLYDFLFLHSLEVAEDNITVCYAHFCGFSDPLIDQITFLLMRLFLIFWILVVKKRIELVC